MTAKIAKTPVVSNFLMVAGPEADRLNPSSDDQHLWILEFDKTGRHPTPTRDNGKWLIFVPREKIDAAWARVREATAGGRLGWESKVSTIAPKELPSGANPNEHVICVFTRDSRDTADVMRVRRTLRQLGFKDTLGYKTDNATCAQRYGTKDEFLYQSRGILGLKD